MKTLRGRFSVNYRNSGVNCKNTRGGTNLWVYPALVSQWSGLFCSKLRDGHYQVEGHHPASLVQHLALLRCCSTISHLHLKNIRWRLFFSIHGIFLYLHYTPDFSIPSISSHDHALSNEALIIILSLLVCYTSYRPVLGCSSVDMYWWRQCNQNSPNDDVSICIWRQIGGIRRNWNLLAKYKLNERPIGCDYLSIPNMRL